VELCFQAAALWHVKTHNAMAFPLGFRSVTAYRQPAEAEGRRLYGIVQTADGGDTFDAQVLDEAGNRIVDLGMLKAQRKRSVYGEQIRHQSWLAHEFQALKTLHAAGADVPQPYEMNENAILMGFIGDELTAAPTLNTVRLKRGEVKPLFARVLHNIELMLAHDIVHADLSAYNILYWQGEITLIDFPQVISPSRHRSGFAIFCRDLTRLGEYFAHQGLDVDSTSLAADLWQQYGYRTVQEAPADLGEDD
jgi:RIO kinase 1